MTHLWRRYLLWFANEHVNFRIPELESILSMYDIPLRWLEGPSALPYVIAELPSEESVKLLASRSVSLRCAVELWARAKTRDGLHEEMKAFPSERTSSYFSADKSFRVTVETFCKTISQKEKVEKIEEFSYLPIEGPVNLSDPDVILHLIEYYGMEPNNIPEKPYDLFFGRWVCDGSRDLICKLSLKKRRFIGNTSMDSQLSILMANQGKVMPGDLVLDPFVGTGSLLVAAGQFGGFVLGTDIDFLMLHGKTRPSRITQKKREVGESVKANMEQYSCLDKYLDVIVADCALPLWKSSLVLDAIITDPPYGIREAAERIGRAVKPGEEDVEYRISEEHILAGHVPSKVVYSLKQIFHDLLRFAADHLKLGGRLVFWIPIIRSEYQDGSEGDLPKHKCLTLVANSEQVLSAHSSRRLLTYEKTAEVGGSEDTCESGVEGGRFDNKAFRACYFNQLRQSDT
ncbi:tRNA (guanine(10)-N2)-methyltransferase homolog [Ischnura elegans]|uniref:tRNA (guanine(10)-N2)-methyltransferase homolog n=1 Tax=Ischnura elegans TaxID=197161 RepID=UPI001ED868C3|nr:tRNA (guanine(10)-N2)-methyltransferase homolog [Ischnura elegans]